MKRAVLVVSFGTSYREARERSLEQIYRDVQDAWKGLPVYQAYTSGMILERLAEEQVRIPTVREAMEQILADGAEELFVVPTHMIPGLEYHGLLRQLETYRGRFARLEISTTVLDSPEDCDRMVEMVRLLLHLDGEAEYLLMGHGTTAEANVRYAQMNEGFRRAGLTNVRIASVEARPDLEDACAYLDEYAVSKHVVLHPFMVVAGDHAWNDMAGEEDSYMTVLRERGYEPQAILRGLGEYPQFRQIYLDKLAAMMKESAGKRSYEKGTGKYGRE